MGLIACPVAGKKKSADICTAFIAGAPKTAHGLVFYGVDPSNYAVWRKAKADGLPWYYIDNSYFDSVRGQQFRVTRNALQIDAMARATDGKRFDALGLAVKPMQRYNWEGHIVMVEQSATFLLLAGGVNWFEDSLAWAKTQPGGVKLRRWSADKLTTQKTLTADLEGARCLIAHTSAAAVTALLTGVAVMVSDQSAVAHVRLSSDNSVDDRRRAFGVLADHQFTLNEMKEGLAWAKVGL